MKMEPERWKLTHHSEEFACPHCGAPVYVGETAVFVDAENENYCSSSCMIAAKAKRESKRLVKKREEEALKHETEWWPPVRE